MSESWNPWRDARDNDEATTETATVQRRLPNPAHGSLPEALDFLTILGHAQNLDIDFLPITWFPAIETIGDKGATAEIRQAFIDIKQSYAFKRVVIGRNETFKVLRSEISVLGLANIKRHPNITHLQGICWDIDSDQDSHAIWPVLVFERASGGDLGHFIASESARNLSIGTALGLLQGIAKGLSCLHANGTNSRV
jgi:serine/threonine protein kinase